MILKRLLLLVFIAYCFSLSSFASQRDETDYFRFEYEDTQVAAPLIMRADTIANELFHEFGLSLLKPIRVIIASTVAEFHRIQPQGSHIPSWAVGVAYPSKDLIILLSPKSKLRGRFNLIKTFRHELIHILLGHAFRGKEKVPRWLNEGDPKLAELAYCESFYFISFLKGKFGREAFRFFLQEYSKQKDFHRSLKKVYHLRWPEMESLWLEYLRLRFSWIPIITSSTTLWFSMTLLFLVGYMQKRRRNRLKLQQWEKEEAFLSPRDRKHYH
jgi:hypothetical protein